MSAQRLAFDYQPKVCDSDSMEAERCDHTLNHLTDDGFLNGSWTTDHTKVGTRVLCGVCGKFYGYLPKLVPTPLRRPASTAEPSASAATGSSFCSASDGEGAPAAAVGPASARFTRRSIDYAELRRRVRISDVLRLLEFSPVARSGSQVRGPCPVHRSKSEKSRSFSVNLDGNTFQCFGASCGEKGNQLDLYVATTGLPIYEAAIELCERLGVDVPWKGGQS